MNWPYLIPSLLLSVGVHGLLLVGFSFNFKSPKLVPRGETLEIQISETGMKTPTTVTKTKLKIKKLKENNVQTPSPRPSPKTTKLSASEKVSGENKIYGENKGQSVSEKLRYQLELEAYIKSKLIYPSSAKRLNQQGRVELTFKVESDGTFSDIRVVRSSRHEKFNRAALQLIKRAQAFRPPPPGFYGPNHRFSLPVEYVIR